MDTALIRNFSIIAHIDHGKTTLTDRLLEETGTIIPGGVARLMDSNPIEVERGITIKLAPVRMSYWRHSDTMSLQSGLTYQLNLIDTPGHVDFSYEVSRALHACEGAVLVVDAIKGIQAQTLANYDKAKEAGLTIIPVINKIDMPAAEPSRVEHELIETLGFSKDDILLVSAKTGEGVPALLNEIISRIPPPQPPQIKVPNYQKARHLAQSPIRASTSSATSPAECIQAQSNLKCLIFNSTFDVHKGVIAFIKVVSGTLSRSNLNQLYLVATNEKFTPLEIGYFSPHMVTTDSLGVGEVGYIATGHKDIRAITIGDTITTVGADIVPIPGYQRPQPMVFMDLYPIDAADFRELADALGKLALNDASLTYHAASSPALGHGFRVGFLGILHAEIVTERLLREFEVNVVTTSPSVPYHIKIRRGEVVSSTDFIEISSPADYPRPEQIESVEEPMVTLTIFTPDTYVGAIMDLAQNKRSEFIDMQYVGDRVRLNYLQPLSELITNFYDRLKSVSSGYASIQYDHAGYQKVDAVKVDILLNGEPAEALSFITIRTEAESRGRVLVEKLAELIPRSQVEVAIQAAIGGKIIARATIRAYRKDVEAKLHGGDMSRNRKLLEKQKKGKKKMKMLGSVSVPQSAFTEILKI